MKNRIEKTLREVITLPIKIIEHHNGLTVATLENGSKWTVNHKNLQVDMFAKNENGELENLYVTVFLDGFKAWDKNK